MASESTTESYQQSSGGTKESPLHTTPKEIKPGYYSPGLTAGAGARTRGRERLLRRKTAETVKEALDRFHGTRGPAPSDEALWAKFAWKMGYGTLQDAMDQAKGEIDEHAKPLPVSDYPKVLQSILTKRWQARKSKGGAR